MIKKYLPWVKVIYYLLSIKIYLPYVNIIFHHHYLPWENKKWLPHSVNGEKGSDQEEGPGNNAEAHGKAHGKPYAFAYMDQWKLAMEDWDQERANEEIAFGDGDKESWQVM